MTPFKTLLLPAALLGTVAVAAISTSQTAGALDDDAMLQSVGPDVIVGDLYGTIYEYGPVGGQTAYSFGTESCNIGTVPLAWIASTPQHPVIGQQMYRLKDGRFEMIGFSWLKHGFTALNLNLCNICNPTPGTSLGVGCSDPYSGYLNGLQSDLGPRAEVNAYTGDFPYPPTINPSYATSIARRLVVDQDAVNPALNAGARYFIEGHYVHPDDDTENMNGWNNMSWREISFSGGSAPWICNFVGSTQREAPAIEAWQTIDPNVDIVEKVVPGDGSVFLASSVTANPGGGYDYVYVLYNKDSDRSINAFGVPVGNSTVVTDKYYNDVDHHSGELPVGDDWAAFDGVLSLPPVPGGVRLIAWHTANYNVNPNANAIRWGTSFTFAFHADTPPTQSYVAARIFKPGTSKYVYLPAQVPQ